MPFAERKAKTKPRWRYRRQHTKGSSEKGELRSVRPHERGSQRQALVNCDDEKSKGDPAIDERLPVTSQDIGRQT
jgi:hypothetical protein